MRVDRARIDGGRDGLIADLTANRIGSSVHFIPLHHHPVFREAGREFAPLLPETERYFDEAVSLPLFPAMTDAEIDDVIAVVRESLRRRCRGWTRARRRDSEPPGSGRIAPARRPRDWDDLVAADGSSDYPHTAHWNATAPRPCPTPTPSG